MVSFGFKGFLEENGVEERDLAYIVMEYVEGGTLLDLITKVGGLGEDGGRYFFK